MLTWGWRYIKVAWKSHIEGTIVDTYKSEWAKIINTLPSVARLNSGSTTFIIVEYSASPTGYAYIDRVGKLCNVTDTTVWTHVETTEGTYHETTQTN